MTLSAVDANISSPNFECFEAEIFLSLHPLTVRRTVLSWMDTKSIYAMS
jgi:hypothetical protein